MGDPGHGTLVGEVISFDKAMEIYNRGNKHSESISLIAEESKKIEISDRMINEALYEIGEGTKESAWRVIACALRAGGFEVVR